MSGTDSEMMHHVHVHPYIVGVSPPFLDTQQRASLGLSLRPWITKSILRI